MQLATVTLDQLMPAFRFLPANVTKELTEVKGQIVNLTDIFHNCSYVRSKAGLIGQKLPSLAIATKARIESGGRVGLGIGDRLIDFDSTWRFTVPWARRHGGHNTYSTALPPIPTDIKNQYFGVRAPSRTMLLFEAKDWETHEVPVYDPVVLRQVHGNLCEVLYAWDLTEEEKRALSYF